MSVFYLSGKVWLLALHPKTTSARSAARRTGAAVSPFCPGNLPTLPINPFVHMEGSLFVWERVIKKNVIKKKNMSVPTNGKSGCNSSSRLHNPGIRPLLRLRQRHRLDETNPAPVEVGASSRSAADRDFSPPIPPECPHPDVKSLYPQRFCSICLGTYGWNVWLACG